MESRTDRLVHVMARVNHAILFIEKTVVIVRMVGMLVFGFLLMRFARRDSFLSVTSTVVLGA